MTPTRWQTLVLLGVVSTVVSWLGLDLWTASGRVLPPLTWVAVAGTLVLAWVVWLLGAPVKAWTRGTRDRPLNPLLAARTAVLAKATSHGGAILTGWYLGQLAVAGVAFLLELRRREVTGLACVAAALVLTVVGVVVERGCRVPPDDGTPLAPV